MNVQRPTGVFVQPRVAKFDMHTKSHTIIFLVLSLLMSASLPAAADAYTKGERVAAEPGVVGVTSSAETEFEITYLWKINAPSKIEHRVFVHFTDDKGIIQFQNDHEAKPTPNHWKPGTLKQGPHKVKVHDGKTGTFQIRMGLYDREGDQKRARLLGKSDGQSRIIVGKIVVGDGKVVFIPIKHEK